MSEHPSGRSDAMPTWMRPFALVVGAAAVMWAVEVIDRIPRTDLQRWGIRPREVEGLVGVGAAPFLHADFGHLLANTTPFLILGFMIAASGLLRVLEVTVIVALVAGAGTWLVGPAHTLHIGASSIVFGYVTYLLARGLFERRLVYLIGGVLVVFLYGGILWGMLPRPGISWQGHTFGTLGGVIAAAVLHSPREEDAELQEPSRPS